MDVENNINIYGYAMHLLGTVVSLVTFVLGLGMPNLPGHVA